MAAQRFVAVIGGARREVLVDPLEGGRFRVVVDGAERIVDARRVEPGGWSLLAPGGGAQRLVEVDGQPPQLVVAHGAQLVAIELTDARKARAESRLARDDTGPKEVRAPMPGKVVKLLAKQGEQVKAGQGVVVVEAMKMENELRAPRDGTLLTLTAREGQNVEAGQTLATVG